VPAPVAVLSISAAAEQLINYIMFCSIMTVGQTRAAALRPSLLALWSCSTVLLCGVPLLAWTRPTSSCKGYSNYVMLCRVPRHTCCSELLAFRTLACAGVHFATEPSAAAALTQLSNRAYRTALCTQQSVRRNRLHLRRCEASDHGRLCATAAADWL
jgi:hypothetical protein